MCARKWIRVVVHRAKDPDDGICAAWKDMGMFFFGLDRGLSALLLDIRLKKEASGKTSLPFQDFRSSGWWDQ